MESLTVTHQTRAERLENFCGDSLLQWTGLTKVKTEIGEIKIEVGDTIIKKDDGTFEVQKATE